MNSGYMSDNKVAEIDAAKEEIKDEIHEFQDAEQEEVDEEDEPEE